MIKKLYNFDFDSSTIKSYWALTIFFASSIQLLNRMRHSHALGGRATPPTTWQKRSAGKRTI